MEMETNTMHPKDLRLTAEEENALASQVLEITLQALQTLDQSEERDVWSMEEGDDSVFYSDEDQTHQDIKSNTSCDFGVNERKHLVNSDAAEEPILHREGDPGAETITDKENLEILTEQELQTPKAQTMYQSDHVDPEAEANLTPEKSMSGCGKSLQPNCTDADIQKQTEQNTASEKANAHVKEEEVVLGIQTPNLISFDISNEESSTRLNGEENVSVQMSSVELQTSGNRQLEVDQEPEQDHNFHFPMGFHHGPSPGYSTLPLLKTSSPSASHHNSFDHLTSSKYSTVSYRKIRRGNTRQKIEEFEYIINL